MLLAGQSLPPLGRVPEVVSDEPYHQASRCRPGKGRSGDGERPDSAVGQIGGERPKGILAYALFDEVTQGRDILVREQGRERIAALQREHACACVQRVGARELAISRGGGSGTGIRSGRSTVRAGPQTSNPCHFTGSDPPRGPECP